MCGIAGIISPDASLVSEQLLHKMASSVAHRGPDGERVWINPSGNAGFAHRRLSILDLSTAAAQPMHFLDRYTIVYNGEIYNYLELRNNLIADGFRMTSASDTEVILVMFHLYKERCLDFFDGMFALAIWDEQEQQLFCCRDRFGEKPLFYHYDQAGNSFYFGSEMKVLAAAGISKDTNHPLLLQFIAHGYTSDPADHSKTFDNNISKLPAAHFLYFSFRQSIFSVVRYWEIGPEMRKYKSEAAVIEQFSDLFLHSVKVRLRSDVSVGSSLSGGLDSSAIAAAIARAAPGRRLKTFTASFPDYEKDETRNARSVAEGAGYEHYLVSPAADDLADSLHTLMHFQEQPFSSASVYAQYKVFQLARENDVVVLLDGQGADEILAGYNKYTSWRTRSLFPHYTARYLQNREVNRLLGNKQLNREYVHTWFRLSDTVKPVVTALNDMLRFDTFQYGLEELLRYADRNSMAHGREVRLPFLHHELVNFIFSLPDKYKIRAGWTKWILRMSLQDQLPEHIIWNRKKTGFEPPQKNWMQHPRMVQLLMEAKKGLVEEGILDKCVLNRNNDAHDAYEQNAGAWRYLTAYLYGHHLK